MSSIKKNIFTGILLFTFIPFALARPMAVIEPGQEHQPVKSIDEIENQEVAAAPDDVAPEDHFARRSPLSPVVVYTAPKPVIEHTTFPARPQDSLDLRATEEQLLEYCTHANVKCEALRSPEQALVSVQNYSADQKLQQLSLYTFKSSAFEILESTTYEADGVTLSSETTHINAGVNGIHAIEIKIYQDGHLWQEHRFGFDGTHLQNFTYNANGDTVREFYFDVQGRLEQFEFNKYNADGSLAQKQEVFYETNNPGAWHKTVTTYEGNRSHRIVHTVDGLLGQGISYISVAETIFENQVVIFSKTDHELLQGHTIDSHWTLGENDSIKVTGDFVVNENVKLTIGNSSIQGPVTVKNGTIVMNKDSITIKAAEVTVGATGQLDAATVTIDTLGVQAAQGEILQQNPMIDGGIAAGITPLLKVPGNVEVEIEDQPLKGGVELIGLDDLQNVNAIVNAQVEILANGEIHVPDLKALELGPIPELQWIAPIENVGAMVHINAFIQDDLKKKKKKSAKK